MRFTENNIAQAMTRLGQTWILKVEFTGFTSPMTKDQAREALEHYFEEINSANKGVLHWKLLKIEESTSDKRKSA